MHGVFSYSKMIVDSCIIDNILFTTWLYFLVSPTLSLQSMAPNMGQAIKLEYYNTLFLIYDNVVSAVIVKVV